MRRTLNKVSVAFETRYKEIAGVGLLFAINSVLLYKYLYVSSNDDVVGLIAASSLFFSIILIGQSVRGWRDVSQWRSQFVKMRTKKGISLDIKKRQKKKWK